MDIADIQTIKNLGQEFGWTDRQVEIALMNAIRLTYVDKELLVEVDVNLEFGSITVRRRSGYGEHGVWVDINNPILPSVKQLIATMELMQYGDGAPGRILEGEVAGFRDGGVLYRLPEDKFVIIPENLLAVADYHEKPPIGTKQVLAMCASIDEKSKMRTATRRGKEFVSAVTDAYYPESVSGIWMGASNSWAVIRMKAETMSAWLEKDGVNVKHLQTVLGLRRITLVPEGKGETEQEIKDNELKHFVNNAWKACKIDEMTPEKLVINMPIDQQDPRKVRTFTSMLQKLAPEREHILL
ncbi:MAG: hypothetical protein COY40_06430 [Alphaproteobacteria bacterium CG_4_10_14_0_8_um_filter_53_9]|nr:MAG: hypothetical protein COY40_06430 [Alphaproteobacteria bacterium CG_4_10_14_0_8_um_filter_53_9]